MAAGFTRGGPHGGAEPALPVGEAKSSGGPGWAGASHVSAQALPGFDAVRGLSGWPQQVSSGPSAFINTISLPQLSQRRRVPAFTSTGRRPFSLSVARRQGLGRVQLHDGTVAGELAAAGLGAHDLGAALAAGVALAGLVALLVS